MFVEVTETTLKRLDNYVSVVRKAQLELERRQWQVMTLETMHAAEEARSKAFHVRAVVAYAHYLYKLQNGHERPRSVYGDPLLSQALARLMDELGIHRRLVPEPTPCAVS